MLRDAMAIDEQVHRFTTAEYDLLVDSGVLEDLRVELLDGLLVDMSPQDETHWRVIQTLMLLYAPATRDLRVQAPLSVAEGWVPEPDLAIADHDPDPGVRPYGARLVVEVSISSKRKDLEKAAAYAAAGVTRYWLVDVPGAVVLEHTEPTPDGYRVVMPLRGDDVLDAHVDGVPTTTVAAILPSA